jgi:ribosome-associated translation inhibitor RaiA
MIAPLQAQIDAIEEHADVVIPLMADIQGLKGVIAATEDKNVMLEAVDELMSKLQRQMSA